MTFLRRLLALVIPRRSMSNRATFAALPSPRGPIAAAFLEWAGAHGLRVHEARGLRMVGRLAGRDVVVDPGIDGAHPGWVQLTVAIALPSVRPTLITRATRPVDFATARIRALFEDTDLGPDLRAISVGPHHLRLRLAPGASPLIVEHAVHAVGDVMRVLHAAPAPEPRHPSTTTAPYPS